MESIITIRWHHSRMFSSRFGPIISTKAILDKATNRCKGYGFVDFESPTSALAAVNELQGQGIQVPSITMFVHKNILNIKNI